jgi:acyl-CoA synthetase (AMP-forming)/AMP-acid ligase II
MEFKNFYELFKDRADKNKEKIYLIDISTDKKITYEECDKITDKVANYLVSIGITPKDIISTVLGSTLEYIYLLIGAAKVGVMFNPISPKLSKEEVDEMLKNSNPKLVVRDNEIFKDIETFPDKYEDKFKPDIEQEMFLLYSSGTTGKPKGIVLTQKNLLFGSMTGGKVAKIKDNKIMFDLLPLSFLGGILPGLIVPMCFNGTTLISPWFDKENFWKIADKYRVNYVYVVPTIFNMLLEQNEDTSKYDLSCIDFFLNSSASLPKELSLKFKERFKVPIYDSYGLSETLGIAIQAPDQEKIKEHSIGKAIEGVQVKIVDEKNKEVLLGDVGEITVKSETIMKEYFKMPEETKKTKKNGWFYTGDLGYQDEEGFLYIVGRKKNVIIKGGMNISPRQISEVFFKHKDVIDAATIGVPDEKYGEEIVTFVVLKEGSKLNKETLMEFAKKHLIKFKVPKEIKIIDKIPRTHLGKLKKDELVEK